MQAASSLFKSQTSPKVSEKKGATCQSFIRKEITTYRIGTLEQFFLTVGQNNFGNKIPLLSIVTNLFLGVIDHAPIQCNSNV